MKEVLQNIVKNVSQFNWQENSLLYTANNQTECKAIFESACSEIGNYYSPFGFKVYKKKIQYKFDEFKLDIQFASSRYNEKGDFIWLEITSGVYPERLAKLYKENKERLLPIVFANTHLLDYKIEEPQLNAFFTKRINILEEEKIVKSKFNESTVEFSRGLNLHKISIEQFKLILNYINKIIQKSIELVTEEDKLIEYLNNPTQRQLYWIIEKRVLDYVNMYYEENSKIKLRLNELIKEKSNPV